MPIDMASPIVMKNDKFSLIDSSNEYLWDETKRYAKKEKKRDMIDVF